MRRPSYRRAVTFVVASFLAVLAPTSGAIARAQGKADAGDVASVKGCVEVVPPKATRPVVSETFPERGLSGYARDLVVRIEHGQGESVKPLDPATSAVAELVKDLRAAGFVLPNPDGGAGTRIEEPVPLPGTEGRVVTTMTLPLLLLPPNPGRNVLRLPRMPLTILRASGSPITLCTRDHIIRVEDPIAEAVDPQPKENPPPIPQLEEWTALKNAFFIGLLALVALVAGYFIARALLRRAAEKRAAAPPPPPRPPWEVALESLDALRFSGSLEANRFDHFVDQVNDTIRQYLGARYGFDGLESTTDEILVALRPRLSDERRTTVETLLRETDLFKFANLSPTKEECEKALERGEMIVRKTMPSEITRNETERGAKVDPLDATKRNSP